MHPAMLVQHARVIAGWACPCRARPPTQASAACKKLQRGHRHAALDVLSAARKLKAQHGMHQARRRTLLRASAHRPLSARQATCSPQALRAERELAHLTNARPCTRPASPVRNAGLWHQHCCIRLQRTQRSGQDTMAL